MGDVSSADGIRIGVVGCGVVGAAIAYELSQIPGLTVTVLDRRFPEAWEATGAALGVLMGAISQKQRGNKLQMRLASLQRYETLVPELETLNGWEVPFNREGILQLCFDQTELSQWKTTVEIRHSQGFQLEILDPAEVAVRYPEVSVARHLQIGQQLVGAIYSPQDRQIDPVALTQALIEAAQRHGAIFQFQTVVQGFVRTSRQEGWQVTEIQTDKSKFPVDWLVLASGLGSTSLTADLEQEINIQPVLGQALHLQRRQPLMQPRPVIYGGSVHLVPLNSTELWAGATVEFPVEEKLNFSSVVEAAKQKIRPDPAKLKALMQQAIALDPNLAEATVIRTWSGLRPRPQNRPAPVLGPLPSYTNVLLATGHYRNGILLAPATAQKVRELITASEGFCAKA